MKNYFSKKSWASYVMLGTLIFAVLALVFSVISNSKGTSAGSYGVDELSTVIAMDVLAIVLSLVVFAVDGLFENKLVSLCVDIVRFAVAAFLLAGMAFMISSRGTLMGFVWFSSLASGSADAVAALNMAVYSWIMSVLGLVCTMVSMGTSLCTKKAAKKAA